MGRRAGIATWIVRVGCAGFAALNLWWGLWATLWPSQFFAEFPGFSHRWTAAYPPYNEHLVSDLGATFLTLAFLLGVSSVVADRRIRAVALAATALFNALHLRFHAGAADSMSSTDHWLSLLSLIAGVLIPIALLVIDTLTHRNRSRSQRQSRSGGEVSG